MNDGNYIQIIKFVVNKIDQSENILCKKIQVENNEIVNDYSALKTVLLVRDDFAIVRTNDIENVCIFIEIENKKYICDLPNPFSLYA